MAAMNVVPPQDEPAPPGLSPIPRILFWIVGTAVIAFPAIIWITHAAPSGANYSGMMTLGLMLGLPCLVLGFIARPGETRRWFRTWVYVALLALVAAIVGVVVHNALGEDSLGGGIAFFVGIAGIPAFIIAALAAVVAWLLTFETYV